MATIATINGIHITVFANDHMPPHFHVRAPGEQVLVAIADLTVIGGGVHPQVRRTVWPWIEANLETIRAEWNRLHPDRPA